MKKFVAALALLLFTSQTSIIAIADENLQVNQDSNRVMVESAGDLNLGGSFIGHGAPNLVTRSVSLNIDGLTNAGDAFNLLNRGDGSANFTRNLDSVGFLTNDNYIQNSLYFNRGGAQNNNTPSRQNEVKVNNR